MRAIVAHPGRQHSHQLAIALHERNSLARYWTGIPTHSSHSKGCPRRIWNAIIRYSTLPLPLEVVSWNPVAPVLNQLATRVLPASLAKRAEILGYRLFDQHVARNLRSAGDATLFIGYETACLESFEAAKKLGMTTVLDAASIHHTAQDRLHPYVESARVHEGICRMKDAEIQLADHILTLSQVARQTYADAGVPGGKLHCVTLGADLDLFRPANDAMDGAVKGEGFHFLFAGSVILRKGVDLLLNAFSRMAPRHPDARLTIAGGPGDASHLLKNAPRRVRYAGATTQEKLVNLLHEADCLVLPSRNDSFGMVVAEALACGVPVIVSDMVGAKEAVVEGINGWIVRTGDLDALTQRMSWCISNRADVAAMRRAAVDSARPLGWKFYRQRVADLLGRIRDS